MWSFSVAVFAFGLYCLLKDWWIREFNGHANTLVYKLHKAREIELL